MPIVVELVGKWIEIEQANRNNMASFNRFIYPSNSSFSLCTTGRTTPPPSASRRSSVTPTTSPKGSSSVRKRSSVTPPTSPKGSSSVNKRSRLESARIFATLPPSRVKLFSTPSADPPPAQSSVAGTAASEAAAPAAVAVVEQAPPPSQSQEQGPPSGEWPPGLQCALEALQSQLGLTLESLDDMMVSRRRRRRAAAPVGTEQGGTAATLESLRAKYRQEQQEHQGEDI